MKYKCKKTLIGGQLEVCEKDKWYEGSFITNSHYEIIYYKNLIWSILPHTFDSHFYTTDEIREMEINKLIN